MADEILQKIAAATDAARADCGHIFAADALARASAEFFGVGWERTYFQNYTAAELGRHLYTYMCAKASGTPSRFYYRTGDASAGGCIVTTQRHEDLRIADELVDSEFLTNRRLLGAKRGVSVRCYFSSCRPSKSPLLAGAGASDASSARSVALPDQHGLSLYVISTSPFVTPNVTDCGSLSNAKGGHVSLQLGTEFFAAQNRNLATRGAVVARYDHTLVSTAEEPCHSCIASITHGDSHITTPAPGASSTASAVKSTCLQLGFKALEGSSYFASLSTLIGQLRGVRFVKKIVESFSNGAQVYTYYLRDVLESDIRAATGMVALLPSRASSHAPIMELYVSERITPLESLFATAVTIFAFYFTKPRATDDYASLVKALAGQDAAVRKLNALNDSLFRETVQESSITIAIQKHLSLFKAIFATFAEDRASDPATTAGLLTQTDRLTSRSEREMFRAFMRFGQSVLRTNFFKENKAAMSFRLDPSVFFDGLEYPRVPYAIIFVVGAHFRGFHVRFHDIARGGIRIIRTASPDEEMLQRRYAMNRSSLFVENYNLALTQMLKNKDIPESGSKGTILVSVRARASNKSFYLKYVDSIMDLVIDDVPGVVSRGAAGKALRELLFFGPDEGTADDFPDLAALHARRRGYRQWQSFATGKSPSMGGIPHDRYGCTTRGIRQYALGAYRKLGLNEETLTKFMTGGPDGDLGSNEIKLGRERVTAICDGFASVHDPDGIDRAELLRLAEARQSLQHLDATKLSPRGFKVGVLETNVKLPDGTLVANGTLFRDSFHFSPYADADVFVPCGGRPASVTLDLVPRLFKRALPGVTGDSLLAAPTPVVAAAAAAAAPGAGAGGTATVVAKPLVAAADLRWRIVVEGANLFFTNDARIAAERAGIVLFKDAATNKGGVTSSSLEVLAGLALDEAEHRTMACVPAATNVAPAFYQSYVKDLLARIEANAAREFDRLWDDSAKGVAGGLKTHITDALSLKINKFKEFVQGSSLSRTQPLLFRYVVETYMPESLRAVVPFVKVVQRVPQPYLEAIFSAAVASGFVYATGLDGNEFSFFQYMLDLTRKAEAHARGTGAAAAAPSKL
jgi:glutamate dehydrogenase